MNAQFNRDLNTYRGFVPAKSIKAQGLISPNFGYTFKMPTGNGTYQGVYVGAGPYLAIGTDLAFDNQLRTIFASTQNVVMPNTTFTTTDNSAGQLAMSVTVGYRRGSHYRVIPRARTSSRGCTLRPTIITCVVFVMTMRTWHSCLIRIRQGSSH